MNKKHSETVRRKVGIADYTPWSDVIVLKILEISEIKFRSEVRKVELGLVLSKKNHTKADKILGKAIVKIMKIYDKDMALSE